MKKKIRTTRKRLLSVLLAAAMVLAALPLTALPAVAATSGDFEYAVLSETDKTCEITGYTGSATALTIPSELDGYTVTSIGWYAFSGCTALESITIPDSVTSIGLDAFYDTAYYNDAAHWENDALYIGNHLIETKDTLSGSYTIRAGTKTIADTAFDYCTALESITIPDSVTSIGEGTFFGCTALTEIKVDTGNPNYASESGVLFNQNKTELICYPAGKQDRSYTIPNSVMSIGVYAFEDCTALTCITIPDSVTSIGEGAFFGCTALTEIKVDTGNPNYISESGVLFNRNKTELICYPAGKQDRSYTIPDSVTSIGWSAFASCTLLTSITIPNSVTSISGGAFENCTALTSIALPDSVTSIGDWTFSYCTSLTGITIPNSVTEIGEDAFSGCTSLTGITIPDSVTSIGEGAFSGCTSLTGITIPDSVTSIGEGAFSGCTLLTTIYGYTGSYAETFANTNGYTFIALPSGIQEGDLNGDDKINAVDARWVLQAASGARVFDATQIAAADVNGDGRVNAVDARWILQIASGARTL